MRTGRPRRPPRRRPPPPHPVDDRHRGLYKGADGDLARTNQQVCNNLSDVAMGWRYDYAKGAGFLYQLCATFGAPTPPGTCADFRQTAGHCVSKRVK